MKVCNTEGCNYPVFSKGYCVIHYPKKSIKKRSIKKGVEKLQKKELVERDKQFYAGIWDKREHYCWECGVGIYEPSTANFHHILEKRNYPDLRHVEDNIIIVCMSCHGQIEVRLDKCPKTLLLTQQMKIKYGEQTA